MSYYKRISGEKVYLSPVSADDAPQFAEWLNDGEVTVNLNLFTRSISLEAEREFLASLAKSGEVYSIIDLSQDQLLGNCGFHRMNHVDGIADCGIFIGDKRYWNRGYGTEALTLLLDIGFNALNLRNIQLEVFSFNTRAIRCYEKCGFKTVGRRRKSRRIGGTSYDIVYMDILAEEFGESRIKSLVEHGRG